MNKLTPTQETIKKAILADILETLLQQNTLTTLMLNSRQIIRIFRIRPQDLRALREHGIIPVTRKKRVFYYSPLDILDLLTNNNFYN